MIELIRTDDCTECDAVQAQLEEMSVAHEVTVVAGDADVVPMIRDRDRVIGRDEITRYLAELGDLVDMWSHFQSDTRYVDRNACVA